MSVPPEIIRVKRKRDDDSVPVAFLQLDETTKRHCSGNWVYQRRDPKILQAAHDIRPVIHSTKPDDVSSANKQQFSTGGGVDVGMGQREFIMSKASFAKLPNTSGQLSSKKRRHATAIFIERDPKKSCQSSLITSVMPIDAEAGAIGSNATKTPLNKGFRHDQSHPNQEHSGGSKGGLDPTTDEEPKRLKRPGRIVRDQPRPSEVGNATTSTPLPEYHHDMDKLASEMGAWTMDEIQRNIDQLESQSHRAQPSASLRPQHQPPIQKWKGSRSTLSLKPKVPIQRYAERHPEMEAKDTVLPDADTAANQTLDTVGMVDTEMDVDGDWIEEIYQRVPASKLDATVPRSNVGVIRFGDEKEELFFYGAGEGDSDAEMWEDEEDENAEDYYGADYPEDEVDVDDEFDRNAYKYRTGNASDEEEYDLHDYNEEDDEFNEFEDDNGDGHIVAGEDPEVAIRKIRQFLNRHRDAGLN
ncbi:hypothetical protein jhhlp_002056 [Lomentospora prolificans]|uniref:Transcription factor Iwr1 domain-containing protein n=1 Tax=Lomentospora prolificans TaxID=41688 RepID=A0A2N3NCY3_9PEZI|nr:hypothetical protein jhhlp_002056 [Lomentospora prolificans]